MRTALWITIANLWMVGAFGVEKQYYSFGLPLPFHKAIKVGNTLYISGLIGRDPKTGALPDDVELEIRYVLDRIKGTLAEAGMTMNDIVSYTVFCTDVGRFYKPFNDICKTYWDPKKLPVRTFVGTSELPDKGAHFEIQTIAIR